MSTPRQAYVKKTFIKQFKKWVETSDVAKYCGLTHEELIDAVEFHEERLDLNPVQSESERQEKQRRYGEFLRDNSPTPWLTSKRGPPSTNDFLSAAKASEEAYEAQQETENPMAGLLKFDGVEREIMNTAQQYEFICKQFKKWVEETDIAEQCGVTRKEMIDSVEFNEPRGEPTENPMAGRQQSAAKTIESKPEVV